MQRDALDLLGIDVVPASILSPDADMAVDASWKWPQ